MRYSSTGDLLDSILYIVHTSPPSSSPDLRSSSASFPLRFEFPLFLSPPPPCCHTFSTVCFTAVSCRWWQSLVIPISFLAFRCRCVLDSLWPLRACVDPSSIQSLLRSPLETCGLCRSHFPLDSCVIISYAARLLTSDSGVRIVVLAAIPETLCISAHSTNPSEAGFLKSISPSVPWIGQRVTGSSCLLWPPHVTRSVVRFAGLVPTRDFLAS